MLTLRRNSTLAVVLVAIGAISCSDSTSVNGSANGGQSGATAAGTNPTGGSMASNGGATGANGGSTSQSIGTGSTTTGSSGASSATGSGATASTATTSIPTGGVANAQGGATGTNTSSSGASGTATGAASGKGGTTNIGTGGSTASQGGTLATGGTVGNAGGGSVQKGGATSTNTGGTSVATGGSAPAAAGTSSTACTSFASPSKVGTIQSTTLYTTTEVKQLSGMVASRDNANTLYAQCDSGTNKIFVFDETGKSLGSITLTGLTPVDWEDLSIGVTSGTDYIYVADIGDNNSSRATIVAHRFPEPASSTLSVSTALAISSVESKTFVYPDKAHNAEAFLVDPRTQDIIIVTKETTGKAGVFRAPSTAFGTSGSTTLEKICDISTGASGTTASQVGAGDISPSGDAVILRTYGSILLFPRLNTWATTFAATPVTVPSATEQQSEGLTFNRDGTAWFSAGETDDSLYKGISNCK